MSVTARMAATTLALEAFLVFFATLVAATTTDLPGGVAWGGGCGLAVLCLLVAGLQRRPWGLAVGWVIQVLLLASGFVVTAMFFMGAVFVAMWAWLLSVGRRIDRDRAAWAAADGG